jgi:release factor glutamine methyltransferase
MKTGWVLAMVQERLKCADVVDAQLEAELILRHVLNQNAVELFLSIENEMSDSKQQLIKELVERRLSGEPLAYITGAREFYGLRFAVNQDVLIPRPETEHLVDKAIELAEQVHLPIIADIGTGSGVIAVSLAKNLPAARFYAVDISPKALKTARYNAEQYQVEGSIQFLLGDLAEPLPEQVDILVANMPYVKSDDCAISHEPHLALDGGVDGLAVIEKLCAGLQDKLKPGGSVVLEIGQGQEKRVKQYLAAAFPGCCIETIRDLAGIERVVCACVQPAATI